MEQELKKLVKLGKKKLVKMCENLGIKASDKDKAAHMAQWILDEVEDLNTWMEAKANVKTDKAIMLKGKKEAPKGKTYLGKDPITKEKLYL